MATLGGLRESQGAANDAEIESLARFAVDEHNKKEVVFFFDHLLICMFSARVFVGLSALEIFKILGLCSE